MPVGFPEFVDNPENCCPVVLLLDTSSSMAGDPLDSLHQGMEAFRDDLRQDAQAALMVELAVISFGPVQLVQDFVPIEDFVPPRLQAQGFTPIGQAIDYAIALLNQRKQRYKEWRLPYYRPWIVLITDGAPTDNWQPAAQRVRDGEDKESFCFFAVGVAGADMDTLKKIAPPQRPPVKLNRLNFQEMFVWLSTSMKRVSKSQVGDVLALPPVDWGKITL